MEGDTACSFGMSTEQTMAKSAGESGSPCCTPDSGLTCTVHTTPPPTPKTKGDVSMETIKEIMGDRRPMCWGEGGGHEGSFGMSMT